MGKYLRTSARKDKHVAMRDADFEGVLGHLSEPEGKPLGADRLQARFVGDGCGDSISQEPAEEFAVVVPIESPGRFCCPEHAAGDS